jgi:hypothetical protein
MRNEGEVTWGEGVGCCLVLEKELKEDSSCSSTNMKRLISLDRSHSEEENEREEEAVE